MEMMPPSPDVVEELERCRKERALAVDCYRTAIKNIAHYTIELEGELTDRQRKYLTGLAEAVNPLDGRSLIETQATLRGLLRDYRDKASQYLARLQEELESTAESLELILASVAQVDGDHEMRLRQALGRLLEIAADTGKPPVHAEVAGLAGTIEESVRIIRKQHQVGIGQFQSEIRMLHKRIDALEAAAAIDQVTRLLSRAEMEERIRKAPAGFRLLLIRVQGFQEAERQFNAEVAAELVGAFVRRMRNNLPPTSMIGRWDDAEFIALLTVEDAELQSIETWVANHLGGKYACLQCGKTVRPSIQVSATTIESAGESADEILEKAAGFLTPVDR
jgi:GGDEF domain-containing protein